VKFQSQKLRSVLSDRQINQIDLQKLTAQKFPPDGVSLSAIRQAITGLKSGIEIAPKLALSLGLPYDYFLYKKSMTPTRGRRAL
jgi:hypothetical protein